MERWSGRVALVTGASAGIGAAIAKELVLKGMKVVGAARRVDRVEALRDELKGAAGKLYPLKCDVSQESDILSTFEWITKNLGGVDVMINNAGGTRSDGGITDGSSKSYQEIFNVNVMGLTICTREAAKSMKARGVDDGHIINLNSVAGHKVIPYPGFGTYTASKFAVTALTEAIRNEMVHQKTHIRVTSISPGFVHTEFVTAAGIPMTKEMEEVPALEASDIADSVLYVLGAPPHVQINELTITPTGGM